MGRPNKNQNNQMRTLKLVSFFFMLFLLFAAYIIRFDIDSFIDFALISIVGGVILTSIVGFMLAYRDSCKK